MALKAPKSFKLKGKIEKNPETNTFLTEQPETVTFIVISLQLPQGNLAAFQLLDRWQNCEIKSTGENLLP